MKIISLNSTNIVDEHICCAFSDKKCTEGYQLKKQWLSKQFDDGLRFKKFDIRGKVFIEYIPAEKAWAPLNADGYMFIQCFWVSGKYKGQGYGKKLYEECLKDSEGKNGIVVLSSAKKQPFMNDLKFFKNQGFELCDTAPPYFQLWYKKFKKDAPTPSFKDICKSATSPIKKGLAVYYSNACPFTEYYINTELKRIANQKDIPLTVIKLENKHMAQNHFVPFTVHSVFYNGEFITQHILNEKAFDRFIKPQQTQ